MASAFPVSLDGTSWRDHKYIKYLKIFRVITWQVALSQKTSIYRAQDLEKLQTQEAAFITNFYSNLDVFGFFNFFDFGQNSTFELALMESINSEDQVQTQAAFYFNELDIFYNTTNGYVVCSRILSRMSNWSRLETSILIMRSHRPLT